MNLSNHSPSSLVFGELIIIGFLIAFQKPLMTEKMSRTCTSPGLAVPGPHPGARPGVGARRRAPGGRVFAHGTWPGAA